MSSTVTLTDGPLTRPVNVELCVWVPRYAIVNALFASIMVCTSGYFCPDTGRHAVTFTPTRSSPTILIKGKSRIWFVSFVLYVARFTLLFFGEAFVDADCPTDSVPPTVALASVSNAPTLVIKYSHAVVTFSFDDTILAVVRRPSSTDENGC